MRRSFLLIITVASVFSATVLAQTIPREPQLNSDRGVVLARNSARGAWGSVIDSVSHRVWSCAVIKLPSVSELWVPSPQQIRVLEPILAKVLAESLSARPRAPLISDYYRQYVGIVVSGRRLVFINGFHESFFQWVVQGDSGGHQGRATAFDWRRTQVQVCDGGEYYFGAIYDPNSASIVQSGFNVTP